MTLSIIIPVLNDATQATATLRALAAQPAPEPLELILVDDGSKPPIRVDIEVPEDRRFTALRLEHNQGRAGACNAGIGAASGIYLTFLDVDCVPGPGYLASLLRAVSSGAPLVFGDIHFASGDPFFDSYENGVQAGRRARLDQWATNLTSANVTIRRDLVLAVDGFDPAYRHYGFEDRDFFLRLNRAFPDLRPVYNSDCAVEHVDPPRLEGMLAKFERSGCHTAALFRRQHPDAYRTMPMYRFDARGNPVYRHAPDWLLNAVEHGLRMAIRSLFTAGYRLRWDWLAVPALKALKGLAFMRGTLSAEGTGA